jgi:hypothetical protein
MRSSIHHVLSTEQALDLYTIDDYRLLLSGFCTKLLCLCLWSQYVMELSLAFHFSHPIPISEEKWLDFKIIGQKRFTECVVHMLFMI